MAKIVRNPRVPYRIRTVDFRTYAKTSGEKAEELARWYEEGDLLILKNYRFEAGCATFNKLLFPNRKYAAKTILHVDESIHGEPPRHREWDEIGKLLCSTKVALDEFRASVAAANAELIRIAAALFPLYAFEKRLCIYNLTEMLSHNMHFDSPHHAGDYTQLRIFVNLDAFPRIWRVGQSLESIVRDCYGPGQLHKTIGQHPRQFTRSTTMASFGDRYDSGAHRYPMHSIAFQPGEVWFLNPNMMAHEVVYGRRLLDGVFLFDRGDLRNPDRYYPKIVERLHKEQLGNASYLWRVRFAALKSRLLRSMAR